MKSSASNIGAEHDRQTRSSCPFAYELVIVWGLIAFAVLNVQMARPSPPGSTAMLVLVFASILACLVLSVATAINRNRSFAARLTAIPLFFTALNLLFEAWRQARSVL